MNNMTLTILGCHSATPRVNTHPTSQVLEIRGHVMLIDCGEGTQVQLRKYKIKFSRIKHIFISHLHGDHYFGLAGLISTFRLMGREADLHVYGPKGIKEVITLQMKLADSWTNYRLFFHELNSKDSELIFEDEKIEVHTIPLDHRIYTNGFLFREKPHDRKLLLEKAIEAKIDKAYFNKLKAGDDVVNEEGELIPNDSVTAPGRKSRSYAFCSDTMFYEPIVPLVREVDLLYHEATFQEKHKALAEPTKHSTAKEAATIAKMAGVKALLLGHFSSRYDEASGFKREAETIFSPVYTAAEGERFEIG